MSIDLSNIPRISLAQIPTPLQKLERVSRALGTNVWIKRDDLTGSLLSGNKVRKLEFTVAQALTEGATALITSGGIQSNHCRATAVVGAQLGLKVCLVLRGQPEEIVDGNLLLDSLCGAEINTFASSSDIFRFPEIIQTKYDELTRRGYKPFVIPIGASDGLGLCGYLSAVEELQNDFLQNNIDPEYIVCATGSGGTQAGLTLGVHLNQLNNEVLGMAVCDNTDYFHKKVRSDVSDWMRRYGQSVDLDALKINVNDRYIGPGYAKAGAEIFDTIGWLAREEGVVLDPIYTGKAFHGMIEEIKSGLLRDAKNIVFLHTGGVFGVFPYKQNIPTNLVSH
jgi:D-cysteine desulfhydrase